MYWLDKHSVKVWWRRKFFNFKVYLKNPPLDENPTHEWKTTIINIQKKAKINRAKIIPNFALYYFIFHTKLNICGACGVAVNWKKLKNKFFHYKNIFYFEFYNDSQKVSLLYSKNLMFNCIKKSFLYRSNCG